jgi:bifunctional non-homologous end joining protein LigD
MGAAKSTESVAGVPLTNLDQPLFEDSDSTKRDLVDYLDAVHTRLLPEIEQRPLSVVRVRLGTDPFMQKNVPKYAPDWLKTTPFWAESSRREVHYALCDDRRSLVWFANQRAVEYHPTLGRVPDFYQATHLVLDLDPPEGSDSFGAAVQAALLVRQALQDMGLDGAVKTSGAKGVHVFVPITADVDMPDAAAATRAIAARAERIDPDLATTAYIKADRGGKVFVDSTRAGGATVVAAFSPRVRPGAPVSFPVPWDEIENVSPRDFTIRNAASLLGDGNPWADALPAPQTLPADLVAEGHGIPVARVVAMHEGKRRKRAAEKAAENESSG